jgi:hypothetical protein
VQGEARDGRNPNFGSGGQPCRHGGVEHLLDAEHVEVVVVRQVDGAIRLLDAAVGDAPTSAANPAVTRDRTSRW